MFGREPLVVIELVKAVLTLVVVLGLALPAGLEVGIVGLILALGAAAQRSSVTPVPASPLTSSAAATAAIDRAVASTEDLGPPSA